MPYRGVVVVVLAALAAVVAAVPAAAKTLQACKKGCTYKTIQDAVDASGKGDTVKVKAGTYNEGVLVLGHKHDKLKLQGNPGNPNKVKLIQRGLHGSPAQNAVAVSRADNVTITGFYARDFKANGFYVENAKGYKLDRLIAERDGEYGLFAFNSIGGSMTNSTAFSFNDSGFYVGQTPPQRKPKRTKLSNLTAYLNVLGYSGTNSRYVDIENSDWFNNGDGIVPNSLDSERFPPNADNTIRNNRVFWNNFNYYLGAPFRERKTEVSEIPYPVGIGIFLYGGRGNRVENNQVFGNWLAGVALIDAFTLKNPAQRPLIDNQVLSNSFGLNGTDLNGRDLAYEGGGTANCFAGNQGVSTMFPADGSTIVPCTTPPTANVFNEEARNQAISWATDPTHEAGWVPHAHAPQQGLAPVEHYGGS